MNKAVGSNFIPCLLLALAWVSGLAAQKKDMPREDVIEFPAVGEALCIHNLFQSNMVLQRDKPVATWGWASPGEKVSVSFAGKTKEANHNDLPFATQRSDDWRMENVPVKLTGAEDLSPKDFARRGNGESKKALRLDDLGRRLAEAQALIDEHKERYEKERAAERKKAAERK